MIPLFDWPAQRPKCFKKLWIVSRCPEFGGTPICPLCTSVKSSNECYYFKITSRLWSHAPNKNNIPSDKNHFQDFPSKEKRCFIMLLVMLLVLSYFVLPCFFWHNLLQRQEFWVLQLIPHVFGTKNEIYYSLLLFICHDSLLLFTVTIHLSLFTPNFCLFKGGCPLYLKQVFSVLSTGLLP